MPSILVVDDDSVIRDFVSEVFKRYDSTISVHGADGCDASLKIVQSFQIDCVFLDQRLNLETGTTCLRKLRQQFFPGAIIIFTGFLDEHVVSEAMKYGADDFVLKDGDLRFNLVQAYESAMVRRTSKIASHNRATEARALLSRLADKLDIFVQEFRSYIDKS